MTNAQTIGKYEIIAEIGRGSFGVVYRAHDPQLERTIALKVLHPYHSDPTFVRRFEREAKLAAQFNHPNIVTVYEVGQDKGQHYLAMAYIEGQTLADRLKAGPMSVDEALTIIGQIAAALDAIHRRGLTHRDVKPGNIMLAADGRAVLLDFGLVRAAEGVRLTSAGTSVGTFEYMAPEQIERPQDIDGRADVYALGVIAYELLVGQLPFSGPGHSLLYQHVHQPPPHPTQLKPDLSPDLEPPLLKALAKAPADRFQQAGEFAAALHQPEQISVPRRRQSAPPPEPQVARPEGDTLTWEKDGKAMVRVPAGEFLYGDNNQKQTLPEFWIDKTPVTNAEYVRFVADTGCEPPQHWLGKMPPEEIAEHPVIYVSWNDAVAYAQWAGKRLPTESEWEKAARGTDGRDYPWGDEQPTKELCNFNGNVGGRTPAGSYSPQGDSPYGCVDMSGNVWEWTASNYDKSNKVLRGGGWGSKGASVRTANRLHYPPPVRNHDIGFRCAAALSPGS